MRLYTNFPSQACREMTQCPTTKNSCNRHTASQCIIVHRFPNDNFPLWVPWWNAKVPVYHLRWVSHLARSEQMVFTQRDISIPVWWSSTEHATRTRLPVHMLWGYEIVALFLQLTIICVTWLSDMGQVLPWLYRDCIRQTQCNHELWGSLESNLSSARHRFVVSFTSQVADFPRRYFPDCLFLTFVIYIW